MDDHHHSLIQPLSHPVPEGPLRVDSAFYIERPPLESHAFSGLSRSGSLLRLKAPRHMGKSSLLLRMDEYAQRLGYATCTIDFLQSDRACFQNLNCFLRWFCRMCGIALGRCESLDDWWDDEIGSKVSSTIFFEHCLLNQLSQPVVLFINEVNRVFEHEEIAEDFLSLLRFWHEQGQRSPIWQKLRLVMAYSTEVYVPLKLEQSPFNVGIQLKLPEFTPDQVRELAERYDLSSCLGKDYKATLDALMQLVGGHPYLIHIAIAHLCDTPSSPQALLENAAHFTGIYGEYLRQCLTTIRSQPNLLKALQILVASSNSLKLDSSSAYQLNSLGIVTTQGEQSQFSCELYRRFFQRELGRPQDDNHPADDLRQENERLQALAYTDALTLIPNRRSFDIRLAQAWHQMISSHGALSLMMCDIDHFKHYNDTYGHLLGDQCLRLVARVLRQTLEETTEFVARYGGEEFAVILLNTDIAAAYQQAELLRSHIRHQSALSPLPAVTMSIGIARTFPASENDPQALIAAADQALYEAKRRGRDRVATIPAL